jgi:hypothetical protein
MRCDDEVERGKRIPFMPDAVAIVTTYFARRRKNLSNGYLRNSISSEVRPQNEELQVCPGTSPQQQRRRRLGRANNEPA